MSASTADTPANAGPTAPTDREGPTTVADRLGSIRDGVRAATGGVATRVRMAYESGRHLGDGLTADRDLTDAERTVAGQTATMVSIITLGVLISVGILLYGEVSSALPEAESPELQNASDQTDQQFADAMELAPVIMFVLIVGVVISVVRGL